MGERGRGGGGVGPGAVRPRVPGRTEGGEPGAGSPARRSGLGWVPGGLAPSPRLAEPGGPPAPCCGLALAGIAGETCKRTDRRWA